MKKRILFVLLVFCLTNIAHGQSVSLQEAYQQAQKFLTKKTSKGMRTLSGNMDLSLLWAVTDTSQIINYKPNEPVSKLRINASSEPPLLYLFNVNSGNGYVLVSGDRRTIPVLAYSLDSGCVSDQISGSLRYWMANYAREISYLKETNASISTSSIDDDTDLSEIPPMITTH